MIDESKPKIEDYATIESIVNGVPVYSFSNIMYVYGQSPDLAPDLVMQEGNTNPAVKFTPKKSWEIKHSYNGANSEMTRRSPSNDSQPLLPIHLIDGDPETPWCSWGCAVPDGRPEWIRIDLPMETEVVSVALLCSKHFPWTDRDLYNNKIFGRALPKEIEIQVSKDAWHWETVYENKDIDADNVTALSAKFEPIRAKQIWIKANKLAKKGGFHDLYFFSIGEVEVADINGNNVASVIRGAGVTVSSTHHGHNSDRHTQDALWNTLQYDLGNKWIRFGIDNGSLMWHFAEHEKGKIEIDPVADVAATECVKNDIDVILALDFKGNWLYSNTPRKANWKEARFREFNDFYTDGLPHVLENPEMFEAYQKYAECIVEHFKDRVTYFEIGNEWDGGFFPDLVNKAPASEWYMTRFFEPTYRIIKKIAPNAKTMLGSPCGFRKTRILECLGKEREFGIVDDKLAGSYQSRLVREGLTMKDGIVSVDVLNIGAPYILLRYQDEQSYLKASYNSYFKTISFTEFVDGVVKPGITLKEVSIPGSEIRLTAKIQNSKVTFTVSDGKESVSLDHTISSEVLLKEGAVGMGQEQLEDMMMWFVSDAGQQFDNFQISDLEGKTIMRDEFAGENGTVPAGWKYIYIDKNPVKKGWGAKIDAIGWHPHEEGPTLKYYHEVKAFQQECEALGFKGKYYATEIYALSAYPPGPPAFMSEEQMAKYLTQSVVVHGALDMGAGPCHPHFTGYPHPNSLARWTFPSQVITPCQPSMSYYMWRNVSTVMDDFYPVEFPMEVVADREIISLTFKRGENEFLVAAWLNGVMDPGITESKADITLLGMKAEKAWVVDIMNGTEQELNISAQGDNTFIRGMLIKDYPVFIRVVG